MSQLNLPVLVLNRSWLPVGTTTVRHAVNLVCLSSALFVDPSGYATHGLEDWKALGKEYAGPQLHGNGWTMPVPEIVVLRQYNKVHKRRAHFSRRTLLLRDRFTCQYCGCKLRPADLTLDHVLPRSRGGPSSWENLVASCLPCNLAKRDRTPDEAGIRLHAAPRQPLWHELEASRLGNQLPPSWQTFLPQDIWVRGQDAVSASGARAARMN